MEFLSYDLFVEAVNALAPCQRLTDVTITPELAEDIVKHQLRNRDRKEVRANIAKLTRALAHGFWNPAPVGRICFYRETHTLADGQCRLSAVAESGVSIVVDVEIVDTVVGMDEGRPRILSQELHMAGVGDHKTIATVTKDLFRATDLGFGPAGTAELLRFYDTERAFITECVSRAHGWLLPVITSRRIFKEPQLASIRALAIRQEPCWDAVAVDRFLVDAVTGAGEIPLARTLFEELGDKPVETPKPRKLAITMAAIELYLQGKSPKRITNRKNPKRPPTRPAKDEEPTE